MDKKKSTNKPYDSAGRRDISVSAESVGRQLFKNRIFKIKIFSFIFGKIILFSE
jgi:hypothetical protein